MSPEFLRRVLQQAFLWCSMVAKHFYKLLVSVLRLLFTVTVGKMCCQLLETVIVQTNIADWSFLHWLNPLAGALGVWMAGKIARENGKLWHCLVGTYFTYPIRYLIYNETIWMSTMLLESALAFYHFSKESKPKPLVRRPLRQRSMKWRFVPLAAGVCIYLFVWCAYGDKNSASYGGDEPIYEALYDSFNSWRKDLTRTLSYTWKYTQHYGLYETYQQIVNPSKAKGKQHAFKILGLLPTATQANITAAWRTLSKEYHPDKVKKAVLKRAAQEKFMDIQQAYEVLSEIRKRRRMKN